MEDFALDIGNYADLPCVQDGEVRMTIGGLRMIRYLDENGDSAVHYRIDGHPNLVDVLGMIEWAKQQLYVDVYGDD